MAVTTIAQFAAELNRPAKTLIEQLQAAGINKSAPEEQLTEADKERLLDFLRAAYSQANGERKKITLTRKSTSEIKQADGSGKARTIEVEVRKRRVFVKRDDFPGAEADAPPADETHQTNEGRTTSRPDTQIGHPDDAKKRKEAGAKARKAAAAKAREALKEGKARKAAEAAEIAKSRQAAAAKAREAAEAAKAKQAAATKALEAAEAARRTEQHSTHEATEATKSPQGAKAPSVITPAIANSTADAADGFIVRHEVSNETRPPKARIAFLSYRREDSSGHAGRLYDRLIEVFGEDQVFMDVDNIPPGEDFVDVIQASVWASSFFLLVIGQSWLKPSPANGKSRLYDPNDFVRLEIASALERNTRIIPILVGGARMPSANDLPADIHAITRKQAVELSDARFRTDATRLIRAIQSTVSKA
jgi:hypothetical protein